MLLTEFHRFLKREDKERLLKQRGSVIWLYGLSGSGKSTIANAVERHLHEQGRFTIILDGDNLRTGLNSNLGFTDDDRTENIRRIAETAKILAHQGIITFVSAITPRAELRQIARDILGPDLFEVFIKASYQTCEQRDVKGLYAKAAKGEIPNFTGKESQFDIPKNTNLIIDTETTNLEDSAAQLLNGIADRISATH